MAKNTQLSAGAVNAAANAFGALFNSGKIRAYSGTQPANPAASASGSLLIEWTVPSPAFGTAVNGIITMNPVSTATASASGTPTWVRFLASDGVTALMDESLGLSDANITWANGDGTVTTGTQVPWTGYTFTFPQSAVGY